MSENILSSSVNLPALAAHHRKGWSLDQAFYTSEVVFEQDLERVWMHYWVYVGHISQLPQPGSYFTAQIGREPVILVQDETGQVQAVSNVCRHRGSLVCHEAQGQVQKLVCPYHQWVYDLDGTLRAAKLMPDDFDKSAYSLHRLYCRELEGFLFVSFAEKPPDFEPLKAAYLPHMQMYQMAQAKIAYTGKYMVKANWKLIVENFRECYHCGVGHPEYCSVI